MLAASVVQHIMNTQNDTASSFKAHNDSDRAQFLFEKKRGEEKKKGKKEPLVQPYSNPGTKSGVGRGSMVHR